MKLLRKLLDGGPTNFSDSVVGAELESAAEEEEEGTGAPGVTAFECEVDAGRGAVYDEANALEASAAGREEEEGTEAAEWEEAAAELEIAAADEEEEAAEEGA